jgi:glucosamine--fructose-6-phosphate aminotransferase (isomerizing)
MTSQEGIMPVEYQLDEMTAQVDALAMDVRTLAVPALDRAAGIVSRLGLVSEVYLTGNGDSHHAALATEMAFTTLAGLRCTPLSTLRMLEYGAAWDAPDPLPPRSVAVGISASGGNRRAVQALERAAQHGAHTIAITSTPGSPLATVADHALVLQLPPSKPCPGIRTYQASLVGLLALALTWGQASSAEEEFLAAADIIEATTALVRPLCHELGTRIADAATVTVLGGGPGHGTAAFTAAKLVEAAGLAATSQDLEEWEHVDAHARLADLPIVVIAPPGRTLRRAHEVAARAAGLGRFVIAVCDRADHTMAAHAHVVLPVAGSVGEPLSPLIYHPFAGYLACFTAARLGRRPFQRT